MWRHDRSEVGASRTTRTRSPQSTHQLGFVCVHEGHGDSSFAGGLGCLLDLVFGHASDESRNALQAFEGGFIPRNCFSAHAWLTATARSNKGARALDSIPRQRVLFVNQARSGRRSTGGGSRWPSGQCRLSRTGRGAVGDPTASDVAAALQMGNMAGGNRGAGRVRVWAKPRRAADVDVDLLGITECRLRNPKAKFRISDTRGCARKGARIRNPRRGRLAIVSFLWRASCYAPLEFDVAGELDLLRKKGEVAIMWGQSWGQLIWGNGVGKPFAAPAVGLWGVLLFGFLLGVVAVVLLRSGRRTGLGLFLLLLLIPISAVAGVPNVFTNGTVADANQVNANFAAVIPVVGKSLAAAPITGTALTQVFPSPAFVAPRDLKCIVTVEPWADAGAGNAHIFWRIGMKIGTSVTFGGPNTGSASLRLTEMGAQPGDLSDTYSNAPFTDVFSVPSGSSVSFGAAFYAFENIQYIANLTAVYSCTPVP